MKQRIFAARNDWTGLILRLTLGIILFPHGAQKTLGWFGGPGFAGEMDFFTNTLHIPWLIGLLVIVIEFVGALALIAGLAVRIWALAIIGLFTAIIFIGGHASAGFFMDWFGTQGAEGYEYHLLVIGMALAIFVHGAGKCSLDGRCFRSVPAPLLLILAAVTLSSCHQPGPAPAQRNRQLITAYFNEVWNKGNVQLLDSLLTPDYINHTPSVPGAPKGPGGLKPIVLAIRQAFPDLHYSIEDVIVTGNRAVARVVMTGTHTGPLFGMPPTGRPVRVNQVNIEQIRDGKIAEHWRVTDELAMMRQLGKELSPP